MHPAALIHSYGYVAIVIGTFFEGEVMMLAAGMLAAAGMLSLGGVIVTGMAGTFASDVTCFLLGRFAGHRLGRWFPALFRQLSRAFDLMADYDQVLLVFYQFVPGLCTVTPMAYGMTRISARRFLMLDLVGNTLWTVTFASAGFFAGRAAVRLARTANHWVWIAALAALGGYTLFRFCRQLRQAQHNNPWSASLDRALPQTGTP